MRKGKIICLIGIFIVVTVILCNINKNNIYEKKVEFSSIDEIIEILDSDRLMALNKNENSVELANTDEFNECLSRRKRITDSSIYWSKLELQVKEEDNNLENKTRIIDDYTNKISNLNGYTKADKIDAITLIGKSYYEGNYEGGPITKYNIKLDIVFIDEGEGWVIDYFWIVNIDDVVSEDDTNKL